MTTRRRVMRILRPVLLIGVSLLAGRIVIGLIGSVDWQQVGRPLAGSPWRRCPC